MKIISDEIKDGFDEQVNGVKDEIMGMKDGLSKLGWNILFPLIPLIGLILLIIHALV
jgi:hypothetical protein